MDSLITPSLSGQFGNESVQWQMMNDSANTFSITSEILNGSDHVSDHITVNVPIASISSFLICLLGIPGNLFVIAVYACRMSTSTRMYMFALAIADLEVCVIGVFLTSVELTKISIEITTFCVYASIVYSTLLLAFVSLERLMAVRHPHSFSLSPRRAKWPLAVIAFVAVFCAMVLTIARLNKYRLLRIAVTLFVTIASVMVMIGCYTLMAITMLMNVRAAHRNVGVVNMTPVEGPSTVPTVTLELTKVTPQVDVTSHKIYKLCGSKTTTVKQAKNYRSVCLLFTITVVFIACWMPQWLSDAGFQIQSSVERLFILNSVVNPFIYSAVSRMFRDDVRQFCREMRSKMSSCCR